MTKHLYTQNNFDLLQDPELPDEALRFFVERGFQCRYRACDSVMREGEEFTQAQYFQASTPYSAQHFWLRVHFELVDRDAQRWYWCIKIGDIEGFDGDWKPGLTVNESTCMAQFAFRTWGNGLSDMELLSEHLGGQIYRQVNPNFLSLDARTRELLARGWYWLGAPLDEVLKLTGTQLSAHQTVEWIVQRKEDVGQHQLLDTT